MARYAVIAALLVGSQAWADRTETVVIDLQYVDASVMAAMFGGHTRQDPYETLDRAAVGFALDAMRQVARMPSPRRETVLPVRGVSASRSLNAQAQDLSHLLPDGLAGPPAVAPNRNALIVTGTPEAIDRFREVLALLDVPAPMVNIALRLDEVSRSITRSFAPELHIWGTRAEVDMGGPAVEDNLLSYGLPHIALLGGLDGRVWEKLL